MAMNEYLFARELGNSLSRNLSVYKTTRLWHSLELSPDNTFSSAGHLAGVNCLDIEKQQGRYLLSGGSDGSVSVWDLDQLPTATTPLKPLSTIPAGARSHKFGISSILYYPSDSGLFATGSYDKTVNIWDANEMSVAFTFNLETPIRSIAMASRGCHSLVAVSSVSPVIRLLDLNTGSATHSLIGHIGDGTFGLNWSPRDEYLLGSGGTDGTVRIWDIRMAASCLACLDINNSSALRLNARNRAHEGTVNGLTWSEDGESLITFGHDEKLRIWNLATGNNTSTDFDPVICNRRQHTFNPVLTCLRQSDPQIVFIPSGSEIIGFHITNGNVALRQRATQHKVNSIICRPHQAELYYGSTDGKINMLVPSLLESRGSQDESKEVIDMNKLGTIYQSLVQTPITFT